MSLEPRTPAASSLGIVVIGRNEGERLRRCFDALPAGVATVYVDSGSTDRSRELARSRGIALVELDLSIPFTAARARNAGLARLIEIAPGTEFVQFLDGDCELHREWIERARTALARDPAVVVVCGRRRERFPERSAYNRLCDMEWDTPVGDALSCGGDALMRVAPLRAVGGFDPTLIAGEEPELCFRLRAAGHRIARIDAEMTLHDAAMTTFSQWWSRTKRAGHAAAEGANLHWKDGDRRAGRRVASAVFWSMGVPAAALFGLAIAVASQSWIAAGVVLALLVLAYVVLAARIYSGRRRRGDRGADARLYALSCVVGKWPETSGALLYLRNRSRGRRAPLIEYKGGEARA